MNKCYPCDSSGVCPYETWDNPESMWFCHNHCGLGSDDDCNENDEPTLEWVTMSEMVDWGVDAEVADYLTAMGQPMIQIDTETDEMYVDGEFAWDSVESFVKDVNEHKDEICG